MSVRRQRKLTQMRHQKEVTLYDAKRGAMRVLCNSVVTAREVHGRLGCRPADWGRSG